MSAQNLIPSDEGSSGRLLKYYHFNPSDDLSNINNKYKLFIEKNYTSLKDIYFFISLENNNNSLSELDRLISWYNPEMEPLGYCFIFDKENIFNINKIKSLYYSLLGKIEDIKFIVINGDLNFEKLYEINGELCDDIDGMNNEIVYHYINNSGILKLIN